jgi:hypothetical protein
VDKETKELGLIGCALALFTAFLFSVCFGGCYGCSRVQVADGYRDSTVRKLSETGVLWKTWEVESIGDGIRSTDGKLAPETFRYSVTDPAVIEQLKTLPPGKRVRLHYRKQAATWSPTGEARYFITRIEDLPPEAK